ncbi:MAG: preprotein translocase subunit SecG [Alistipes sp.]|nr:preprotein translocase subunit SecG [Alistipes sp.]
MYTFCIVLILVASVLIILAVLVQNPKSGMAANFGAANQTMGVRQTADFLEKFTWTMGVVVLVLSLVFVMTTKQVTLSDGEMLAEEMQTVVHVADTNIDAQAAADVNAGSTDWEVESEPVEMK